MNIKKIVKELFYITLPALAVAFTVNYLHPDGIALFGQWDVSKGVITAKSKKGVVESLNSSENSKPEITSPEEAKILFNGNNIVFVDARSFEMYEEGHIKGAVNLPAFRFDELFFDFSEKYPIDTEIVTYCTGRECEDSHRIAKNLKELGYKN